MATHAAELRDEVFEWSGDGSAVDWVPPLDAPVPPAPAVRGPGYALVTDPVDAIRAFEVFMGRRYDPAERSLSLAKSSGHGAAGDDPGAAGGWGGGSPRTDMCSNAPPAPPPSPHTPAVDELVMDAPAIRPSLDAARIMTLAPAIAANHGKRAGEAGVRVSAGGGVATETPLETYARLLREATALEATLAEVGRRDSAASGGRGGRVDGDKGIWKGLSSGAATLAARVRGLEPAAVAATADLLPAPEDPSSAGGGGAPPTPLAAVVQALTAIAEELEGPLARAPVPVSDDAAVLVGKSAVPPAGGVQPSHAWTIEAESRLAALEAALGMDGGVGDGAAPLLETRLAACEASLSALTAGGVAAAQEAAAAVSAALTGGGTGGVATTASAGVVVSDARAAAAVAAVERWDGVAAALPLVVSRLTALADVHDAAGMVAQRLRLLESAVGSVEAAVSREREQLTHVRAGVAQLARQTASAAAAAAAGNRA
jgi:hypothetical protein